MLALLQSAQSTSKSKDTRGDLVQAKGTTSWVHAHYKVYSKCKGTANCNLCHTDLQWNSSTSTLTDHIKKVHLPVFQAALTKKAEDADAALREAAKHSTQSITDMKGSYKKAKELSILKYIVHQGLPKGMKHVSAMLL
jgi:hypothetical protein